MAIRKEGREQHIQSWHKPQLIFDTKVQQLAVPGEEPRKYAGNVINAREYNGKAQHKA